MGNFKADDEIVFVKRINTRGQSTEVIIVVGKFKGLNKYLINRRYDRGEMFFLATFTPTWSLLEVLLASILGSKLYKT